MKAKIYCHCLLCSMHFMPGSLDCPGISHLPASASGELGLQECTISVYSFRIPLQCYWRTWRLEVGITPQCIHEAICGLNVMGVSQTCLEVSPCDRQSAFPTPICLVELSLHFVSCCCDKTP